MNVIGLVESSLIHSPLRNSRIPPTSVRYSSSVAKGAAAGLTRENGVCQSIKAPKEFHIPTSYRLPFKLPLDLLRKVWVSLRCSDLLIPRCLLPKVETKCRLSSVPYGDLSTVYPNQSAAHCATTKGSPTARKPNVHPSSFVRALQKDGNGLE